MIVVVLHRVVSSSAVRWSSVKCTRAVGKSRRSPAARPGEGAGSAVTFGPTRRATPARTMARRDEEVGMRASAGDRIVIEGHRIGEPDRDREALNVLGQDGEPPYALALAADLADLARP